MEIPVPLSFRFGGARAYVHGTDLYDSLQANFDVGPPLRLLLRHSLSSNAIAVPCDPRSSDVLTAAASLFFRMGGEDEGHIAVYADPNRPITERYVYDEGAIADSIVFGDDSLVVSSNPSFSPIKRIVAANKLLLQRSPRTSASQWWFARIDLDAHLTPDDAYRLVFNRIRGQQFAESNIECNGTAIGRIYFFARDPNDSRNWSES